MREDNLLCVRRRSFVVTTDSCHTLPIFPNLAPEIKPTAINRLWVADITYIRLRTELHGGRAGGIRAPADRLGAGAYIRGGVDNNSVAHRSDRATATPGLVHHSD